jgi:predicted dithiol-disulfide oxidoreductase (DUF899 family)
MTDKIENSTHSLQHLKFPGESAAYRAARNALLAEEMALRRQIERVSAQRRTLLMGGPVREDYVFHRCQVAARTAARLRARARVVPPHVPFHSRQHLR